MKTLHLICNAHLDPVWMWDWHEGAATALATFYSAAELCDEFDYVFCHNEVVLYEYVEKYAPDLFARIRELVKAGKWYIMGGWYLQPDCLMPAGESFIRQITLGRAYFEEKFDAHPTTAMNVDSFGHTRSLTQILKKCGYDSYFFCRPMGENFHHGDNLFWWEGADGSRIKALRAEDETLYCTSFGNATREIRRKLKPYEGKDEAFILWGVGNHGGGPSRKDLRDIAAMMEAEGGTYEILHSTPEAFFARVEPTAVVRETLPLFTKIASSVDGIKKAHIELENQLYATEMACALASLTESDYTYPTETFTYAERALAAIEFHDVLSGTCAEDGHKSSVRRANAAMEELNEAFLLAFHRLARHERAAAEGENPFVVFGYDPAAAATPVETEILIPDSIVSDTEGYTVHVYQDGEEIPAQTVKELSNINYDRRKRIAYTPRMNPTGITRVDMRYERGPKAPKPTQPEGDFLFADSRKSVRISRESGLPTSLTVDGVEYLAGGAFLPLIYTDNADPWGWNMPILGQDPVPMTLIRDGQGRGPFAGLSALRVVEDGPVLTEVETLFESENSHVRLSFKLWRDLPYMDVTADVLWGEQSKALKLAIPTTASGAFFGQTAYGTEFCDRNGHEQVLHRFVAIEGEGGNALCLMNDCTYGASADESTLYATLLNGSAYCAHPIGDRPLVDDSRYIPYVEQGKHRFTFRLGVIPAAHCERESLAFNRKPYSVNMYPHGKADTPTAILSLSEGPVTLSAFRKCRDGRYLARLFNNTAESATATLTVRGDVLTATVGAYAFETYLYDAETRTFTHSGLADIL